MLWKAHGYWSAEHRIFAILSNIWLTFKLVVGGSPTASYFLLTAWKESNPRKQHPSITACVYLALLNKISGCATQPSSLQTPQATAGFKQVLAFTLFCLRYSAWWGGWKPTLHSHGLFLTFNPLWRAFGLSGRWRAARTVTTDLVL